MYLLYSVTEIKAVLFYNERSTRTSILLFMHVKILVYNSPAKKK